MFDSGYLAVCTARDLGWKRVYGIVHKRSRVLEQFFCVCLVEADLSRLLL